MTLVPVNLIVTASQWTLSLSALVPSRFDEACLEIRFYLRLAQRKETEGMSRKEGKRNMMECVGMLRRLQDNRERVRE